MTSPSIVNGRSRPCARLTIIPVPSSPMPVSYSPRRLWLDRISSVKNPRVEFSYPDGSPSQGPSLCLVDWGTNTPSNPNFPPKRRRVFSLYELICCFPSEEPHPIGFDARGRHRPGLKHRKLGHSVHPMDA